MTAYVVVTVPFGGSKVTVFSAAQSVAQRVFSYQVKGSLTDNCLDVEVGYGTSSAHRTHAIPIHTSTTTTLVLLTATIFSLLSTPACDNACD